MPWRRVGPDNEKLKELILYICLRSEGDETFGATKLNKLLFLSDFEAYLLYGRPITGHEYQALDQGPAPRVLLPIMDEMAERGEIAARTQLYFGLPQKRTLALREPDLSRFRPEEVALVDRFIQVWWGKSATEISLASHEFLGWRVAEKGETIPYNTALIDTREPTKSERERGRQLEALAREVLSRHGN